MIQRDEATERQITAARPDRSTWLAANAGSGKTRVLTDRVARLLLDGVSPEHILCLTYTKAAASEMQNRLFRRLGEWAMKPDAPLRDTLRDLGIEGGISDTDLRGARRLFASAIEAPGGLKIQTIHSFCAGVLRRFPLEAGVSPQFHEMEDRAAALLRAEILDDMAEGPDRPWVEAMATHQSDMDFDALTAEICRHRASLSEPLNWPDVLELFGLPADADETTPLDIAFEGSESALFAECLPILRGQSKTMIDMANALGAMDPAKADMESLQTLFDLFLYRKDGAPLPKAKIGSVPTKKAQEALGGALGPFHDFMDRVAEARNAQLALAAAQRTQVLHNFAKAFLPRYEAAKLARGWLDFDDLILKTLALLTDRRVAEWVLYRLDGGIDHILVDEAQDTSPVQWQVIERLAQEFTSGDGARTDVARTIFVVGDKKQSIYSFQGADPQEFDRMKTEFAARLYETGTPLQDTTLQFSFRSAEAILRLVDVVFEDRARSGFSKEETHRAFKSDMGGRVDLWPAIAPIKGDEKSAWDDPVDLISEAHHHVQLAEGIAQEIKRMLAEKTVLPGTDGKGRAVRPGDFLILVRGRASGLFAEINRACKAAGLPIAGADRLRVGAELAVRDLTALMAWLATPEDDLSLAIALKSPLLGWGERDLFDLCQGREQKYLWRELAARSDDFPDTWAMLTDLRDHADFLRPFDLIERVLTRHHGRKRLLARLGVEAEDGINALLSQALAYEQNDIPSLTGFLIWMQADDLEIKRQMDSASDRIRVMTVHGAKGLEAPIVILPDTTAPREQVRDALVPLKGQIVWKTRSGDSPQMIEEALEAVKEKDRQERDRLLYVAMTRAENWLVIAGAGDMGKDGRSWFETIEAAMQRAGAVETSFALGQGLRMESGDWPEEIEITPAQETKADIILPDWVGQPAPPAPQQTPTLSPSDLGGAKALPGEAGQDQDVAKRYGTLVHLALERLATAPKVIRQRIPDDEEAARAHREALGVLDRPELAALFAPDTLAEVALTAKIADGRRLHGVIDRLVIAKDHVLAVDFKTNMVIPDTPANVPEGVLRQMGAYAAMLQTLYPDRRIETAILWTKTASLMILPHDIVTDALARTTSP